MNWTSEDEQRFQEMSRRREAAIKARELPLKALINTHLRDIVPADFRVQAFEALTKNADNFRDALKPFDSGVRPEPYKVLAPAPMPETLWQTLMPGLSEWPETLKPKPGRKFEVKLRNGHIIHEVPETMSIGWAVISDPSDIIAWRYVWPLPAQEPRPKS